MFIDDACHGRAQGSGLNSKMAASRKLAARRGLAATPFGRRFDRPDLMCAAQHPEFGRCATNPSSLCVTARYYHPLLVTTGAGFGAALRGANLGQSSVDLSDKIDKRAEFRRHSAMPLPDKVSGTGLGFVI